MIVTEGTKTEPFYFQAMKRKIELSCGGYIQIKTIPHITIHGTGKGTTALLCEIESQVSMAKIPFQHIWAVFDKDDFMDFHEAIRKGEQKGYHIAWSNPCFEYWLFLHFAYSDASLHRKDWSRKLSDMLQHYQLADTYQKNEEHLYDLLDSIQGVDRAIRYAKRRMAAASSSEYNNPGTTVYLLVEELKSYIDQGCQ